MDQRLGYINSSTNIFRSGETKKHNHMVVDTNKVFPQNESRVNVNEFYEVQYWKLKFNCPKEELEKAVKTVGVSTDKVGEFFKKKTIAS